MSTLSPDAFLERLDALLATLSMDTHVVELDDASAELLIEAEHGTIATRFLLPRHEAQARSTLSMIFGHIFVELDAAPQRLEPSNSPPVPTEPLAETTQEYPVEFLPEVAQEPPPGSNSEALPARQMHISAQIPAVFALDEDEEPPILPGKTTWPDELLDPTDKEEDITRTYLGAPGGFRVPKHALFSESVPESRQQRLRDVDLQLKNPSVRLELREPYVHIEIALDGKSPYSRRCLADVFFGAELSWVARALEDASHTPNVAVSGTSITTDAPEQKNSR